MSRTGRPEAMDGLPEVLRRSVDEWILSNGRHSAIRIFRRFNLVERGIKSDTFRRYVARVRDRAAEDPDSPSSSRSSPRARLLDKALSLAEERLDAKDAKHLPGIMAVVRAANDMLRVEIEEAAETRAEELHQIKIEQLSKDLRRDVDERTEGGKKLGRQEVHDMIDRIMRGEQ